MVKKSPENTTPAIVDNVEALEAKLKSMREAQAKFAEYTQEQVDKIFYEAAMARQQGSYSFGQARHRGDRPWRSRGQGHQEPLRR